ncbi:MAG: hypothetical protein WA865_06990 [Spirulinaceae cyanobacterium]
MVYLKLLGRVGKIPSLGWTIKFIIYLPIIICLIANQLLIGWQDSVVELASETHLSLPTRINRNKIGDRIEQSVTTRRKTI